MDKFKQIETFVSIVRTGSLSAAARSEGVAAAIVGRRLDALEHRLGVKLLVRTTRRINLTPEGQGFLDDCQRLLTEWADAEVAVSAGGRVAKGQLRVTAPAGFGRKHVAPLLPKFRDLHPGVRLSLDLSDRVVDLSAEGFDCAVRLGDMPDSSLVSTRLADNRRLCVATPKYLRQHGSPKKPVDLLKFDCLCLSSEAAQSRGWAFKVGADAVHVKPLCTLDCSDGQVLHEWCLGGHGIAWRSTWEVADDIAAGRLLSVLDEFAAPPNGIFAVFAQRKHAPVRLRLWLEFLKAEFAKPGLFAASER